MGEPQMNLTVGPQEFFRERICEALASQKLQLSVDIEFYLVNLLCEFISPEKLETVAGELDALETPLAIMLKKALEAPPANKIRIYKYLGDTSLYMAGFFQDYFNRKAFNLDYYVSLGSTAYHSVSSILSDQFGDEHFTEMYRSLSQQFADLVEVVAEVSDSSEEVKDIDLLAIYDRWTRNNSARLRRILEKCGITPIPNTVKEH